MPINPKIIREYDIRGIVDQTLTTTDAFLIGWSFAQLAQGEYVNVACDGRLSSPIMTKALIDGLIKGGAKTRFIGIGPTPMLYFSAFHFAAAGGIMITGSHNPPTHNGFKFIYRNKPFFGEDIRKLAAMSFSAPAQESQTTWAADDSTITVDCTDAYIARIMADNAAAKQLKIVWDPGNGATGNIVKILTEKLPGQHILVNEKIDGHFPNHHPDPTVKENLEQIIAIIKEQKCDFGLAFDGDGDRIGVVDSKGRIVWGDQLLLIFAKSILAKTPGAVIIADVKASQKLFDGVAALGGEPLMWKTGHSLIKTKMQERSAPLAGEMSGHIFFADRYYGYDDAMYAALRLIDILATSKLSLTEMIDALPEIYNTPEIRIDCDDDKKFTVIDEIKAKFNAEGKAFNDIDGIRFNYPYGWWLLRASNTQAVLVARCEADSPQNLELLCREVASILEVYELKTDEL